MLLFGSLNKIPKYWFILSIIFITIGVIFSVYGMYEYNKITEESITQPKSLIILGNEETIIKDMKIIVTNNLEITSKDNWMEVIIELNLSPQNTELYIDLPNEIKSVYFINYSETDFFYTNWSYDKTSDISILYLNYNSSNNENTFRIGFDWKTYEKISYDQERVVINFINPYYGKPIYQQRLPVYESNWIPRIEHLTIQIDGKNPVDLSLTYPTPSLYYYNEGKPSVYWIFDSKKEISSVQAVFKNPNLSQKKNSQILFSGLFFAIGISTIFLGIGLAIDIMQEIKRLE